MQGRPVHVLALGMGRGSHFPGGSGLGRYCHVVCSVVWVSTVVSFVVLSMLYSCHMSHVTRCEVACTVQLMCAGLCGTTSV